MFRSAEKALPALTVFALGQMLHTSRVQSYGSTFRNQLDRWTWHSEETDADFWTPWNC